MQSRTCPHGSRRSGARGGNISRRERKREREREGERGREQEREREKERDRDFLNVGERKRMWVNKGKTERESSTFSKGDRIGADHTDDGAQLETVPVHLTTQVGGVRRQEGGEWEGKRGGEEDGREGGREEQ